MAVIMGCQQNLSSLRGSQEQQETQILTPLINRDTPKFYSTSVTHAFLSLSK